MHPEDGVGYQVRFRAEIHLGSLCGKVIRCSLYSLRYICYYFFYHILFFPPCQKACPGMNLLWQWKSKCGFIITDSGGNIFTHSTPAISISRGIGRLFDARMLQRERTIITKSSLGAFYIHCFPLCCPYSIFLRFSSFFFLFCWMNSYLSAPFLWFFVF